MNVRVEEKVSLVLSALPELCVLCVSAGDVSVTDYKARGGSELGLRAWSVCDTAQRLSELVNGFFLLFLHVCMSVCVRHVSLAGVWSFG